MSKLIEAEVLCTNGTIEVVREPGDTKILLVVRAGFGAGAKVNVAIWLSRKQQQSLREAVRETQSKGYHRWP